MVVGGRAGRQAGRPVDGTVGQPPGPVLGEDLQGGVRDLFDGAHSSTGASPYLSLSTTIFGGGLLAGCLALVMKRIR